MKIMLGADPLGYDLKNAVKENLAKRANVEIIDISVDAGIDYFTVGQKVGAAIASHEVERGFIFCGTGMGVNIVANKYQGVYSALCESIETTRLSRVINDANILALGGIVMTPYMAIQMANVFLDTAFSHGFSEAEPEFLQEALVKVQNTEAEIAKFNVIKTK